MMDNYFKYEKEERDGVILFKLIGIFDTGTASSLQSAIDSLLSPGQSKVLFDLYDLEQVDSSGVAAFIVIFKRIRSNNGEMRISRLVGQPREMFNLLRLDRVFEIYNDLDEAIKSFQ